MKTANPMPEPWRRLPNGNLVHQCGIELVNDGRQWRMTDESGLEFALFAIRDQGLSSDEAQGLADFLVEQGANWANFGLH